MSDCDCQKNIKNPPEPTVDDVKEPIGDGLLIATLAAMTTTIFFGLKVVGIIQDKTLSTSSSLLYLLSLF